MRLDMCGRALCARLLCDRRVRGGTIAPPMVPGAGVRLHLAEAYRVAVLTRIVLIPARASSFRATARSSWHGHKQDL